MKYFRVFFFWLWMVPAIFFSPQPQALAVNLNAAMELNRKGEQLVEKGEYRQAINVFGSMQDSCGGQEYCQGVALFWLGRCYFEVSEYDRAMGYLKRAEAIFVKMDKPLEKAKVFNLMGRLLTEKTDYDQALTYYDLAEKLLSGMGQKDDGELFWVLINRATVTIYLNQYDKAGKNLDQAEKLLSRKPDPKRLALLKENRGLIFAEQQYYNEALKLYDEAMKHYRETGNLKGICGILNKKGQAYEYQSELTRALEAYQEALTIAVQLPDLPAQAFILNNLGMVHRKRGNYEKALEIYNEALKIRSNMGKDRFYSETLNNLGLVKYLTHPEDPEAYDNFKQCYEIALKVGSRYSQATALHNMAWVLKDRGDFSQSRLFSQTAIVLAEEIKHRRFAAQATLRLGNLYEYYGNFEEALKQYERAARLQSVVGDKLFLSYTLVDMANMMTRHGKLKEAEQNYEKALALKEEIGVPSSDILCQFAIFFMEKHRFDQHPEPQEFDRQQAFQKARDHIERAEQALRLDASDDVMLLMYTKGRYCLEKDPKAAVKEFTALKTKGDSFGRLKYSFLGVTGLGIAYENLGQLDQSEMAYASAVAAAEELRKTLDSRARLTFLDGEEILGVKHVLPYEGLARVRMLKGDKIGSLEASEFAKARSFSDKLAQRVEGSSFGVDKKVLERLERIETQMTANYQRLEECRSKDGDRTSIIHVETNQKELAAKLRHIEREIQVSYPKFFTVRFPRPLPIDKSALAESEQCLCYQVTDSGVIVYLAKGKTLVDGWFEPVSRSKLNELVRRFRKPLEIRSEDDFDAKMMSFDFQTGSKLRMLLLERACQTIKPGQAIIIVPDDCLAELPFEMLTMNDGGEIVRDKGQPCSRGGMFLEDRNPVSYRQSITALTLDRQWHKGRAPGPKVLVIADPTVSTFGVVADDVQTISKEKMKNLEKETAELVSRMGGPEGNGPNRDTRLSLQTFDELIRSFPALPETRKLIAKLKNVFGVDRVDDYAGEKATLDAFTKKIAPNLDMYGNIIFATHGYYGNNFREICEPFLLLSLTSPSQDALLRMSLIMDLKVNADIVALVACQTGLGKRVSGEGTMGMGAAFQYAGANSVLMSLWSVDETRSLKLIELFLTHASQGRSKIEALRLARKGIREGGDDHPFFWASFILTGETGRP